MEKMIVKQEEKHFRWLIADFGILVNWSLLMRVSLAQQKNLRSIKFAFQNGLIAL